MSDKFKFIIPGKPEYLTMVRLAIGSIADSAEFNVDEIEDIKTSVGEACKAICCHGKEGIAREYVLECSVDKEMLEIKVSDTGSEEMEKMQGAMKCMDCPNEGDLGIFVIKTLMSEVELIDNEKGKKTIKMVKRK